MDTSNFCPLSAEVCLKHSNVTDINQEFVFDIGI
jgi:hypothetical protein